MLESNPILITEAECSKRFSLSTGFLRRDRLTKQLLPFIKIGTAVRYNVAAVTNALHSFQQGGKRKGGAA